MRIIFRTLQHRLQAVRPQHLPDERTNHQYRRYGLPLRHRIRFKSAYRHTYPAPIRCTESAGYDWRRCNRTAVQLYHCHFAGKRPSSTPLVNAGAISACSMVQPVGNPDKKWDAIVQNITELCGSAPQLIDELYKSETATNFNNRSIAWLLKNYNRIYDDPDVALDLYTRQCSLGITAEQLGIAAGTIANNGVNPVTRQSVFDAGLAPKITSMISTVGFYEHSGDWMYTAGIPAKSGVGGGVMAVLPGVMGVSAFAPPLDEAGNSVKAQLAVKFIMNKLGLGVFNGDNVTITE